MKKHLSNLRDQHRRLHLEMRFNYDRTRIIDSLQFENDCHYMDQRIEEEFQEYLYRERQREEEGQRMMREREEEISELYYEYLREAEERERQSVANGQLGGCEYHNIE